jgi:hypothetical protein
MLGGDLGNEERVSASETRYFFNERINQTNK